MVQICSSFWMIRDLLKALLTSEQVDFINHVPHLLLILYQIITTIVVIHSGSATTCEAERTSMILGKLISESDYERYLDFKKFLTQIQTRNLNIQNVFFKINWNVFLTVNVVTEMIDLNWISMFQAQSTIVTYLITCQFDTAKVDP